jgi:hypothetical protein
MAENRMTPHPEWMHEFKDPFNASANSPRMQPRSRASPPQTPLKSRLQNKHQHMHTRTIRPPVGRSATLQLRIGTIPKRIRHFGEESASDIRALCEDCSRNHQ